MDVLGHGQYCVQTIFFCCLLVDYFDWYSGFFPLKVLDYAKRILLGCAAPDAVLRAANSRLSSDEHDMIINIYFEEQHHDSLLEYVHHQIQKIYPRSLYAQVQNYTILHLLFYTYV